MNGSMVKKPHLIKNGIRIICNTENFVPIVVPGLSNSSSGSDSSTSRTLSKQESHCSTSSSTSSSSPTVSEIKTREREREDRTESDISPVTVSTTVHERSGLPDIDQANKNRKSSKKEPKKEQSDSLCSVPFVCLVLFCLRQQIHELHTTSRGSSFTCARHLMVIT